MDKRQALALQRLVNDDDFRVFIKLLEDHENQTIERLLRAVDQMDIYRAQGECSARRKLLGLFDDSAALLGTNNE